MENDLKIRFDNLVNENYILEKENQELKDKLNAYEGIVEELFSRLHKMERLEERYKKI